jgi:flotillin
MIVPLLAAGEIEIGKFWLPVTVVALVFLLFIFFWLWAKRYVKVGPNEVLVISGRRRKVQEADGSMSMVGFRITKGGGAFIIPIFEKYDILSLELMTIDVKTPEVYTITGVPIVVDGVAQIKVKGDEISIRTAAEQFLSMNLEQIMNIATQTLEGHLRAIVGTLTVEDIYKNRDAFAQRVQEVAAADLANMGLSIVSFTLRDIRDNQGYLDALGKPRTAQVKRDAIIAQAEADRDATIKSAQANQAGQEAKFAAETKIAEANRDYQMKVAEYAASVNLKKADADLAYDLQKNKTNQAVKAEEVQVMVIEKQKQIEVQEKEIIRRQKELEATVSRPADAERYRVQTIAEAEKFKLQTEATGQAEAKRQLGLGEADANKARGFAEADVNKARGLAEADANKARGIAEADVILAQGNSTAEAMQKKADAWRSYNEAAILQLFLESAPAIAKAIAEPLSKTEKIVVINNGGEGGAAGANKITKDVTTIMSQIPEVVKSLSGVDINALLGKLQKIGDDKPAETK